MDGLIYPFVSYDVMYLKDRIEAAVLTARVLTLVPVTIAFCILVNSRILLADLVDNQFR